MKKFVAVLLCVAMLMAGVVARAENGYEFIKYMLSSEDGVRLGYGYSMELDDINTSKTTVIVLDFDDSTIVLLGDNSKGNYEGTSWLLSDTPEAFLAALIVCCSGWSTIEGMLDAGYDFRIQLVSESSDTNVFISSEEEALSVYQIIMSNAN